MRKPSVQQQRQNFLSKHFFEVSANLDRYIDAAVRRWLFSCSRALRGMVLSENFEVSLLQMPWGFRYQSFRMMNPDILINISGLSQLYVSLSWFSSASHGNSKVQTCWTLLLTSGCQTPMKLLSASIFPLMRQQMLHLVAKIQSSGLVRVRPFAIPIQAFCVGDACRSLDVQAAQDLLHRTFNPEHY